MSDLTINEKKIGLWRLKTELAELMAFRQDEELDAEARAAIDAQIKAYVSAELRKVDNVAGFIRYRRSGAAEARAEAKRLSALADSWERDEEYLLGLVKDLMVEFRETKLEGRYGYLKLQANGGNQALDIYNKELIPEEMVDYRGFITSKCWTQILVACDLAGVHPAEWEGVQLQREPRSGMVREALAKPCPACDDLGETTDWRGRDVCSRCDGQKGNVVPGARLEPRGQHVRIK